MTQAVASKTRSKTARVSAAKPLKGKVAIVTGSTSGIGLAIARALAGQGCAVVLNGLGDGDAIERERASIAKQHRVKALYHGADMARRDQVRDLVRFTVEKLGGVDIIVNNAGIQFTAPVDAFPDEKWDAIIAINQTAPMVLMGASLPHMRANKWGRIVNIASVHGLVASTEKIAYVAAKHALVGMTKVVALEAAQSAPGVTCNAICPGWVRTPLVEAQIEALARKDGLSIEDAAAKLLSAKQPSGRFVEVEELAEAVLFLCSDKAGGMTGAQLVMDGGWTAQ